MPELIINHVDKDSDLADELYLAFQTHGWTAACNRHLPVGRRLDEYLEVALTSARCVVTLWTSNSVDSPRIRDVANEAFRRGISVPILAESIVLPLGQRSIKTVDVVASHDSDNRYRNVLVAVEEVLSGAQNNLVSNTESSNPSLSLRIARRIIESLSEQGASIVTDAQPDVFEVGGWLVNVGANTISANDTVRKIQPRAMEVLVYLVSRSPATVSVEEILERVWEGRVVVDSAVHRCVSELRLALDDDAREPRFIETIARRGYRIVAEISLFNNAHK